MAGPRQPIELLLVNGKKHLTKDEIEERKSREVKAKSDSIKPPSFLKTKKQKDAFQTYADELTEIGIMSNLDCDILGKQVFYEFEWEKAASNLSKLDYDDENYDKLLNRLEKFHKMAYQTASSMGLTISSRCKLVVPKKEEQAPKTEAERRFGGRL